MMYNFFIVFTVCKSGLTSPGLYPARQQRTVEIFGWQTDFYVQVLAVLAPCCYEGRG